MQRLCKLFFLSVIPSILKSEEETYGQKDVYFEKNEIREEVPNACSTIPPM